MLRIFTSLECRFIRQKSFSSNIDVFGGRRQRRSFHGSLIGFADSTKSSQHHQLNINHALKKSEEGQSFQDLLNQPIESTLQGIGPKHADELSQLGLSTVEQLANYKFFHLAKSLVTLSKVEEEGGRSEVSCMNFNKGLDKTSEHLALVDIIAQPVHALQGITPAKGEIFASLGVKTIEDLSRFKYCQWAEAIQVATKFEER